MGSWQQLATLALCACVIASFTMLPSANAGIYDDDDLASYLSKSQGDDIRYQGDFRDKRGMCRPGFTYQAILRDCVPSLGALRDRNRTGRGRRGLMSWYR